MSISTDADEDTLNEGIRVEVSKPTGLKNSFSVTCEHWGTTLPASAHGTNSNLHSPVYFDFHFEGLTGGSATLKITHDSVTPAHRIQHYDTATRRWADHAESRVEGKTVIAKFNVQQLHKTPIVIGH